MLTDTLSGIKIKARRIARMPSTDQITDANLEDYINTYLLYNLPVELKLPSLEVTVKGTTKPDDERVFIGGTSFYDLRNTYTNVEQPFYIAGCLMDYYEDKALFYYSYSQRKTLINDIHTGNGILINFTGTLTTIPVLKKSLSFSTTKSDGTPLTLQDDGVGGFGGDGTGTINYLSGAYTLTFSFAPAAGSNIYAQYVPYKAQKPSAIYFNEDNLIVRPIPDKVYEIEFVYNKKPIELITGASPELKEWGLLIAIGAAKLIMEDRGNTDGLDKIAPMYAEQLKLVSRRATRQDVNKRNYTIFSGYRDSSYWGE